MSASVLYVLVAAGVWVSTFGLALLQARRHPNAELEQIEEAAGRRAGPEASAWLTRESRRNSLWVGAGVAFGAVGALVVNARDAEDRVADFSSYAFCAVAGGILGHLIAGARMQPYSRGTVRTANLEVRKLSRYLTRREAAANVVALGMSVIAMGLALLLWRVEGMGEEQVVAATALIALLLVVCCIALQQWLVGRPRASLTSSDLFWQEHLFVHRLGQLPMTGFLVGAAAVVVGAVTILTQDEPDALRACAIAALVAVGVTWFLLLDDDRDEAPEVLRTLEAPV